MLACKMLACKIGKHNVFNLICFQSYIFKKKKNILLQEIYVTIVIDLHQKT